MLALLTFLAVACGSAGTDDDVATTASTSAPPRSSAASSTTDPPGSTTTAPAAEATRGTEPDPPRVVTGAAALLADDGGPLRGRRVGLIANRSSTVDGQSTIDLLFDHPEVELVALFAPEHGLRADGEAGATVVDEVDPVTGVTVHSLYGADRAPRAADLAGVDVLVFDLQDVGARFYTYTATMGLAMQAAAGAGVDVVVLDRPNPLGGDRPDGPVRGDDQESFVSLYPVPSLHALTAGELALAIQGEGWLDGLDDLDLEIVPVQGWDRSQRWPNTGLPWVAPSPGLPSEEAALLYPATVLLEATTLSFGRGTDRPFTQFGASWLDGAAMAERLTAAGLPGVRFEATTFTPEGSETLPGVRLEVTDPAALRPMAVAVHVVHQILVAAEQVGQEVIDRPDYFDLLAGGPGLREELQAGRPPSDIVASWASDLDRWDEIVQRYRLY